MLQLILHLKHFLGVSLYISWIAVQHLRQETELFKYANGVKR